MNTNVNNETATTSSKPNGTLRKRLSRALFGALTVLTLAIAPLSMSHADTVNGPEKDSGSIPAREIYVYRMDFNAGEEAHVAALGDGDIDIKIYDENGNLITKDIDQDGAPVVSWTPQWTGRFTIKIINNEYHSVAFAMRTN